MDLFRNIYCNTSFWCFTNTGQWEQTLFRLQFWFSTISSSSCLWLCTTCKICMVIYIEINSTLSVLFKLPAWFLLSAGHVLWSHDISCAGIQVCLSKRLISKQTWCSDCPIKSSFLKVVFPSLSRQEEIFMRGGGAVCVYHLSFVARLIPKISVWENWRQS